MRLDQARDGWLLDLRQRRRSDQTLRYYERNLNSFLAWCAENGVTEIEHLRAEHARGYLLTLQRLAPVTQHRLAGVLKVFSAWLAEEDLLEHDPFRKVRRPKQDRPELQVLRPEEARRILGTFNRRRPLELRNYLMVSLALDAGLRRGEVCSARLEDLDLEEHWLRVWGKGRRQRRVPVSPENATLLWRWVNAIRATWAPASPYLFITRTGGCVDSANLDHIFKRAVVNAGISRRVRYHDLRHACATWSLRAGMPKERVARMLGHSSDAVTSLYEHLEFEDIQAAHLTTNPLRHLR